jgi:hypothetical protein
MALATSDDKSKVRSQAIKTLSKYYKDDKEANAVIENALKEKSNLVVTASFKSIAENDKKRGAEMARQLRGTAKGDVLIAIANFYKEDGSPEYNSFFLTALGKAKGFDKYNLIDTYGKYLKKQEGKELNDGIASLEDVGQHAPSWFIRYAGVNALDGIEGELKSRENKASDRVEELRKNNVAQKDIQAAEMDVTALKKQHDDLAARIKEIKSNEKEKRLKKRFESN